MGDKEAFQGRSPLGHSEYRALWTANAASNFGGQIQVVGAAWLMTSLTESPQMIALVQTAINLPTVCFILFGGAMADNFDRRRIMLTTQISMLAAALLLSVLAWTGHVTPWLLLALTFTISGLGSLNNPAWQASVRDILPRRLISKAVALNGTSINLARTTGPALGGVIVLFWGAAAAFAANALSFVGFIVALLRWKPELSRPTTPREPTLPAMLTGIRYVARAPHVRNATLRGGLSGISASAAFALLPVVARLEMGGNAMLYGLLLAAFGFGAVSSALLGGRLRAVLAPDTVVRCATLSMTGGLALLAVASHPIVAGVGAMFAGGGWTLTHSTFNTVVQMSTPQWVTARSLALYQTATFSGMAAGSFAFGHIAEVHSVSLALYIAAGLHGAGGLIGLFLPLPRLDEVQTEPLERWSPPALEGDISPTGPIRIEIEYLIEPADEAAFLAAMDVRKRIRKRDGAREWALWQDIGNRRRWVESYRVSSWNEYLRHNSRRTVADLANFEMLDSLNATPRQAKIRRFRQHDS